MATFKKDRVAAGVIWRVQVAIKGVRKSSTFTTKAEAAAWAAETETEIRRAGNTDTPPQKTLTEAAARYISEVSLHKRGYRWERIRLAALERHSVNGIELGAMYLSDITPEILGAWRDQRMSGLKKVLGSTINRDLNLLSHVFTTARREWKWITESPTTDVRRPKDSAHRDRRITDDEIERLCLALGFDEARVETKSGASAIAFLFAIETAMRAGEICGLTADDITGQVAHLPKTKNGRKRDVPLSKRALELLTYLPDHGATIFTISTSSLDALFRKARGRACVENLTFHDSRHEAITRLAKKISVLDLARMVGHTDLNELQTYYNETAADIATKLD